MSKMNSWQMGIIIDSIIDDIDRIILMSKTKY